MKIVPTQGIVLRYSNFKEADRMLTILTPDRGKIQVLARGCRRQKSRFLSASELFSYCKYMLFEYRDIYIMTGADINDVFFHIREDVDRFAYGAYILKLAEISANPEEGNVPLFYLLLYSITMLSYSDILPEDISNIYQIKLSDILGYRPRLDRCAYCGEDVSTTNRFSILYGGVICDHCYEREKNGYNINMGTLQTMKYILDTDINRLKNLKFTPQVREELSFFMGLYLAQRLEQYTKAKDFIDRFKI